MVLQTTILFYFFFFISQETVLVHNRFLNRGDLISTNSKVSAAVSESVMSDIEKNIKKEKPWQENCSLVCLESPVWFSV